MPGLPTIYPQTENQYVKPNKLILSPPLFFCPGGRLQKENDKAATEQRQAATKPRKGVAVKGKRRRQETPPAKETARKWSRRRQ